MPQSLVNNLIHLVFSTEPLGFLRKFKSNFMPTKLESLSSGRVQPLPSAELEDHVHALISLSKNHPLKKIVEEVKKGSSKWMKTNAGTGNKDFHWQNGYAGFSVSHANTERVKRYIEHQKEHHRHKSFQEELREFFKRQGIEYDERYVWD